MAVHRVQVAYQRLQDADGETRVYLLKHYLDLALSGMFRPILFIAAVLLRVVLLTLKPLVHIRFGRMYSHAMGVWTVPTEIYMCEKDAGVQPTHARDFFYHYNADRFLLKNPPKPKDQACNQQLNVMFDRTLHVSQIAAKLDKLNRMVPRGSQDFIVKLPYDWDQIGMLERFPAHLTFTEEEAQQGKAGLVDLGVEPGSPFVCFHARDFVYRNQVAQRWVSLFGDWNDNSYRDSSIGHQLLAAQKLTEMGYFALRMGKYVEAPINSDNPRIIDYGYESQSDFMDMYLSARCSFFIGQQSGMTSIPQMFRTPVSFVNISPFSAIVYSGPMDVFTPKHYYSREKGRRLTFREILSEPLLLSYRTARDTGDDARAKYYGEIGLELLENTPEEIAELAIEMEQRIKGTFEPSQEDEALQERFHAIIRSNPQVSQLGPDYDVQRLRIGAHFLRTHQDLLD